MDRFINDQPLFIEVMMVDDHKILLNGLASLLETDECLKVKKCAGSPAEALEYLKENVVDVIISDLSLGPISGFDFIKEIKQKYPDIKTVVLSMHKDESSITEAFQLGVHSYISKDLDENEIITAVKKAYMNERYFPNAISDILLKIVTLPASSMESIPNELKKLTCREMQILKLIIKGHSNKMISQELNLSERTVSVHRYNLMKKLGTPNSASLVMKAINLNIK